ncbi:MAG: hypothetical protein U0792_07690 [Gemmataceae bacterium]
MTATGQQLDGALVRVEHPAQIPNTHEAVPQEVCVVVSLELAIAPHHLHLVGGEVSDDEPRVLTHEECRHHL